MLTAWRVAEVKSELPTGVATVVERLLKAEDAFGFDTSRRVGVWRPTSREFDHIQSAIEFQDRALVRNVIWRSVDCSTFSAREFEEEAAAYNATDYGAVRRQLLQTISRAREIGFQSAEIAKKLQAFNRSFARDVVDAIVRDAMAATDPVDRALLVAASELMEHWHKSSSLVRSTQEGVNGRHRPREEALRPDELKEQLRVVEGLVKIHRELTRNK